MTIQKFDAAVVIDTARNTETWCVFEHQAVMREGQPPETILIGACRLKDVYELRDGKTNSEWMKMFANGGHVLVRVVATSLNRADAFRIAGEMVQASQPLPRCNLLGYSMRQSRRPVVCLNNGIRYETQQHAARALGLHASSISRQLSGKADTAQGMKFAYVMQAREENLASVAGA